jgi:hypothetical protein
VGGCTNTNEGKVTAASLLGNWNNIVRSLRNTPSLIQAKASDILVAKIAGAKVLKSPTDGSGELMSLAKTDGVQAPCAWKLPAPASYRCLKAGLRLATKAAMPSF